jgi:hypothetical protein
VQHGAPIIPGAEIFSVPVMAQLEVLQSLGDLKFNRSVDSASYLAENGPDCLRTLVASLITLNTSARIRPVCPGDYSDGVEERVHYKQSKIRCCVGETLFSSTSIAIDLYRRQHFYQNFLRRCGRAGKKLSKVRKIFAPKYFSQLRYLLLSAIRGC